MKNLKRILIFTLILTMLNISQVFADIKYTETEMKEEYDKYYMIIEDLILVYKNGKFGLVDKNGKEFVKCKYSYIFYLMDGLYCGITEKGYEIINIRSKEVMPYIYEDVDIFPSEGMTCVTRNGKSGCIDKSNSKTI